MRLGSAPELMRLKGKFPGPGLNLIILESHNKMQTLVKNKSGFTIIELLMAMAIGIIVLAGIYAAFDSQQKIHTKEQQVTNAVQNVRGAAHFMVREIRLAGMDVTGTAGAGFLIAGPHSIQFTLDRDDGASGDPDGDVADADEDITYSFLAAVDTNANGIADPDATSLTLTRTAFDAGLGAFTDDRLAEDIYAVGFAYAFDSDGDGEVEFADLDGDSELDAGEEIWAYDSDADGNLDKDNDTGLALASTVSLDQIRAVRVWILARTRLPLRGASGLKSFTIGDKPIIVNDNFKYRLLTTTVKCRNMGI
jgi:type IV pilus assembly protein PilW